MRRRVGGDYQEAEGGGGTSMNLKSEGTSLWRRNAGGKRKITKRRRMRRKRKNKNRRRRGE